MSISNSVFFYCNNAYILAGDSCLSLGNMNKEGLTIKLKCLRFKVGKLLLKILHSNQLIDN